MKNILKVNMNYLRLILYCMTALNLVDHILAKNFVPILSLDPRVMDQNDTANVKQVSRRASGFDQQPLEFLPFILLIDKDKDTSEYWRETEILSLIRNREADIDYDKCEQTRPDHSLVQFASRRTVRPICRSRIDHQLCPQCPQFNNHTECELFRESCRERRVHPSEYRTYCDHKYGKWKTMFLPADYSQCRCCDECVLYRELDQSCVQDEYVFDADEFLPVTTIEAMLALWPTNLHFLWKPASTRCGRFPEIDLIDFRAGCNPYWGHPDQELKALRCDKVLRRCVPVMIPSLPNEALNIRRSYRFETPVGGEDCPMSCRGYDCYGGLVKEMQCAPGAYLPDKKQCNCCGQCSAYQQLNQKCAEFKKTVHNVNGTKEIEVEEEFLEPGCDDGLVCRQGLCQDIHTVQTTSATRKRRDDTAFIPNEPCKRELKYFKKKYGEDGHLHYEAPQCTSLWLYAPVQCRRFVCYCSLEDGTFIHGIKVPRVEVSNMNCDCAREKCRTGSDVECDGYGNYKEAVFLPYDISWPEADDKEGSSRTTVPQRTTSSANPATPSI